MNCCLLFPRRQEMGLPYTSWSKRALILGGFVARAFSSYYTHNFVCFIQLLLIIIECNSNKNKVIFGNWSL
jgi:hypothetical protein